MFHDFILSFIVFIVKGAISQTYLFPHFSPAWSGPASSE